MAVGQRFGRLKSAAGYGGDLVFHPLRKTYATTCERVGIPEGVAADILGTSVEQKQEVVERVAQYLTDEIGNPVSPAG